MLDNLNPEIDFSVDPNVLKATRVSKDQVLVWINNETGLLLQNVVVKLLVETLAPFIESDT